MNDVKIIRPGDKEFAEIAATCRPPEVKPHVPRPVFVEYRKGRKTAC